MNDPKVIRLVMSAFLVKTCVFKVSDLESDLKDFYQKILVKRAENSKLETKLN